MGSTHRRASALITCLLIGIGAYGCADRSHPNDEVLVQTKKMMIGRWTNTVDPGEVLEINESTIKRYYDKQLIEDGNPYELSLSPCEARIDSARATGQVYLKEGGAGDPLCFLAVATSDYLELVYTANGRMHSYRREK